LVRIDDAFGFGIAEYKSRKKEEESFRRDLVFALEVINNLLEEGDSL
jgi:hypothetical protein